MKQESSTLRRALRHEVESRLALSEQLNGFKLTEQIENITNTILKRALTVPLNGRGEDERAWCADFEKSVEQLLTHDCPSALHPKALLAVVLSLGLFLLLAASVATYTRQKKQFEIDLAGQLAIATKFLVQHPAWWRPTVELIQRMRDWRKLSKPVSDAASSWLDLMEHLSANLRYPETSSVERALAFRQALTETRPYSRNAADDYRAENVLDRIAEGHYQLVLAKVDRSFGLLRGIESLPDISPPNETAMIASVAGCIVLVCAAAHAMSNFRANVSNTRRVKNEAHDAAHRIATQHATQRHCTLVSDQVERVRDAMAGLQKNTDAPLDAWNEAQAIAADANSELAGLLSALWEVRADLLEQHRRASEQPSSTLQTAAPAEGLAGRRQTFATLQSSLERKNTEIAGLERVIAEITRQIDARTDTTEATNIATELTRTRRAILNARQAEQDVQEQYKRDHAIMLARSLDLDRMEQDYLCHLDHAESSAALNAARDAIGQVAQPQALSLAMERHVSLSAESLESRVRIGHFTAGQGHAISTNPVELASTWHSIHDLHLALIDAIERAPKEAGKSPHEWSIEHNQELGITVRITDRNEARVTPSSRSMVRYANSPDGRLVVAHIYPA